MMTAMATPRTNGARHDDDSFDDASESTFPTLMSHATGDKDFDWSCSEYRNLNERGRLELFFKIRQKLLQEIIDEGTDELANLLQHHEDSVRVASFRILDESEKKRRTSSKNTQNNKSAKDSNTKNENPPSTGPPKTITTTTKTTNTAVDTMKPERSIFLRHLFLFEARHSFPGYLAMMAYCALHLSAYEVVFSTVCEITKTRLVTNFEYDVFYSMLLVTCLLICRFCGNIWEWVSKHRYRAVKFDIHNRMRLGYWDARIHAWFRHHPVIKCSVYYLSFYLVFIAIYHFQTRLLRFMDHRDVIVSNLPSKDYNITTTVRKILDGALITTPTTLSCENQTCSQEQMAEILNYEDDVFLYSTLSMSSFLGLRGDEQSPALPPITSNSFHTIVILASLSLLSWLGCNV